MAAEEHAMGISSTYYFRCTKTGRFPTSQIAHIADLGHEVGFHYETVARAKGDPCTSREQFIDSLAALRDLVDVKTVAAHGSPLSGHRNLDCAESLDFEGLGLLGEPSIDCDFSRVLYITDTGGVYGSPHNINDRVKGKNFSAPATPSELAHMIDPEREPLILLNSHPERWPVTGLGLVQATITDYCVNLMKGAFRRIRQS
jgi:hypothetical protein